MADIKTGGNIQEEQEELFSTLFDSMPQMGWTARPDGYIDFYNRSWFEYTGCTPEQLEGWGWESVHDPEILPAVKKQWQHSIDSGTPFEMEFPIKGANGQYRWFLTRIRPVFSKGKVVRWVGINTDIDNERRANEVLEKTIEERSGEVKEIAEILSTFVEDGDFRRASQSILKVALRQTESSYGFVGVAVTGGPHGMMLRVFADEGFNWSKTVNRALYEKIVADYSTRGYIEFPMLDNLFGWPILHKKPIISNSPENDERRSGRAPAGHPPMNNYLGVPIMKGDTVVGAFGIANREGGFGDAQVTALQLVAKTMSVIYESYRRMKQEHVLIEERKTAEENLRNANQALIDLAYTVSHELQEPLALIRSQLNLLAARYSGRLGDDADGYIKNTVKSSEVVERIIDDLWEYARIELPHLKFEQVNIGDAFDEVVDILQSLISARNAQVIRTAMPVMPGDRRQITLLLKQLILNGINFNNSEQPHIELTSNSLVDEVEFCVSDNGIGFDQSEVNEVFKMFRKLAKDTPGTGMGLSICQKVVKFHGGRMWAQSFRDGSKFYFTLPLIPAREMSG
jgi:PAS domain S-box-containing protein